MSNKGIFIGFTLGVVVIVLLFYLKENDRKIKEIKKKEDDNEANLKEIKKMLSDIEEESLIKGDIRVSIDISQRINELINYYRNIDDDICEELNKALELIKDNYFEQGINKLAVIIENLLKNKYKNEEGLKKNLKFANLINYAHKTNFFNQKEKDHCVYIKNTRNKESHELNNKLDDNDRAKLLLESVEIIFKFTKITPNKTSLCIG